jgi:hypothetical protein
VKKTSLKISGTIATSILFSVGHTNPAHAWGPNGHAIIADIAETQLSPQAAAEVQKLLASEGYKTLDQVASWPDTIGHLSHKDGGAPETLRWHYVNIPVEKMYYEQERDCPDKICVTEKLPEQVAILADHSKSVSDRETALKWVVHLVGDLHQPLHTGDHNNDRGGNDVKITYFGNTGNGHMNLHSIWDEGILDHETGLTVGRHYTIDFGKARKTADEFSSSITPDEIAYWNDGFSLDNTRENVIHWTNESQNLSRVVVYGLLPQSQNAKLGETYTQQTWPIVNLRVKQAGTRLAAILNAALSEPASTH